MLVSQGHLGAALVAASRGWRDFPDAVFGSAGATFRQLTVGIASRIPGAVAAPAPAEESVAAVAQVSAIPVSAVPVSAPAAQIAAPSEGVNVLISRSADEGTIIVRPRSEHVENVLKPLGWKWAKRGWFFLGDRDTAPDMAGISATVAALSSAGYQVASEVRGDEAARVRPVSAKPAVTPVVRGRRTAATRRETVARQARPVSAMPVSAAPVNAAPVNAAPVSPAVAPADPLSMIMAQLAAMQADIVALKTGGPAPAPAPVVVAAAVAEAPVSAPVSSVEDVLASLLSEELTKLLGMTWMFKVAPGASARKTVRELRSVLAATIGTWWPAQRKGNVSFGAYIDENHSNVIHVKVKAAAGQVTPGILAKQVVGVCLTVHGIGGQTVKSDLV